jgi:hypothetical protein
LLESLFEVVRAHDTMGSVMLAAGALGLPLGMVAAVLNRRRAGFFVGIAALLAAITASGLGAAHVVLERSRVDRETKNLTGETARERARLEGYTKAKGSARAGLVLGAAPLFGGLAGVLAPLMRRRRPRPQSMRMPRSLRSHARHELNSRTGVSSLSTSTLAILSYGACSLAWGIPLPGPAIPLNSPAWAAREAIDVMRSGQTYEGCDALEQACAVRCDPQLVPDLGGAVSECFDLRIGAAEEANRATALDELSETSLPLTAEQRARLREEVDRETRAEPLRGARGLDGPASRE